MHGNHVRRLAACIGLAAAFTHPALAATVTSTADSGTGSLRAALAGAASGETIDFSLALPATITLASELPITQSVVIAGPGANALTITTTSGRILHLDSSGKDVSISGVTLSGGNVVGNGGGILNDGGNLTLDGVVISGNTATGTGGAIFNAYNAAGNQLSIANSTLSANHAGKSGAIDFIGYKLTIANSTVSGNVADDQAGALGLFQTEGYIYNSTIAGNTASFVGGINSQTSVLTFESSIVDGNTDVSGTNDLNRTGGGNSYVNATTTLFSENFVPADNVINGTNSGNLVGYSSGIGPLADNGGTTPTRALPKTSVARGVGSNSQGYAYDQRGIGFPRVVAGVVDMGAVQYVAPVVPVIPVTPVPMLSAAGLAALLMALAVAGALALRRPG
ncbi:MAG: hypothetical protein JSR18_10515 [Proteobacteria bacterium]|nr:hypothetical protein [Pseudomonadota bacterium]